MQEEEKPKKKTKQILVQPKIHHNDLTYFFTTADVLEVVHGVDILNCGPFLFAIKYPLEYQNQFVYDYLKIYFFVKNEGPSNS